MLRRVEADDPATVAGYAAGALPAEPVVAAVSETEFDAGLLPRDHPRWVLDAVAISKAARDAVARLRPVVVLVMSMWDHPLRCVAVAGRRLGIDASGSYRIEF